MKRMLRKLSRAIGVAALLGFSGAVSAQEVTCNATTCSYGPICPDAWGGCYFYTWAIGSAKNEWTEFKGGIANVVKLCKANDPDSCVRLSSNVETVLDEPGPNQLIRCQVPGSKTCTDAQCGGSFVLKDLFSQQVTTTVTSLSCTSDDKGTGGIKCSKSNTLEGLKGDAAAAAQYCPNKSWNITLWWPLNFIATTTVTGPQSRQNPTPVSTVSKSQCWLTDPNDNFPFDQGYQLSLNLAENKLVCKIIP